MGRHKEVNADADADAVIEVGTRDRRIAGLQASRTGRLGLERFEGTAGRRPFLNIQPRANNKPPDHGSHG